MNIVLSHATALRFWLSAPPERVSDLLSRQPQRLPRGRLSLTKQEAARVSTEYGLPLPLHVLSTRREDRRIAPDIRCHFQPIAPGRRRFLSIEDGLFICTPELSFVQVCGYAGSSDLELIWLSYLLHGTWTPSNNEWGQASRPALSSCESTASLLDDFKGNGRKRALRILSLTCQNTASAGENALCMTTSLSHKNGGLKLFRPSEAEINPHLVIRGKDNAERHPDIYLPSIGLSIEYDGEKAHSGQQKQSQDAERRIELASENVDVLNVTKDQLFDDQSMDLLARVVSQKLGRKYQPRCKQYYQKRHELQRFLTQRMLNPLGGITVLENLDEARAQARSQKLAKRRAEKEAEKQTGTEEERGDS